MSTQTIGEVHEPKSMFLRNDLGSANNKEHGLEYDLASGLANHLPIVHSKKSGKWFILSWEDIINLARQAGIDED